MADLYTIWLYATHYGYGVIMELVVDLSDQFVVHYIVIVIVKASAVSSVVAVVRHIHVRRNSSGK